MQIQPNVTLAELAVRLPAASRVFKRHRLDFCCSGHRRLVEACEERGLDPVAVLADIDAEAEAPPRDAFVFDSTDSLIDQILERYHEPLRRELPELVTMAKRVEVRHGGKSSCPHGLAAQLMTLHTEVLEHLAKEEQILFPMIRAGGGRGASGPISVMQREHDDHGATMASIRELTGDYTPPAGACATWRALYLRLDELESELMDHIHIENNVLFPRVLRGG